MRERALTRLFCGWEEVLVLQNKYILGKSLFASKGKNWEKKKKE